jgi:transposase
VAQRFGVDPSSVKRWRRAWREGGEDGLAARPHPGGQSKLSAEKILVDLVVAGPREAGFPTDLWTCARVVERICQRFGVEYDRRHLAKLLRRLGFTPQKPRTVAREQDPESVERWRREEWPRIKKSPSTRREYRLPRRNGLPAPAGEPADLGVRRLHAGAAFVGPTRSGSSVGCGERSAAL